MFEGTCRAMVQKVNTFRKIVIHDNASLHSVKKTNENLNKINFKDACLPDHKPNENFWSILKRMLNIGRYQITCSDELTSAIMDAVSYRERHLRKK